MENRISHRTRASMKLLIYKADIPAAVAVTRDISKAGVFLLTNFTDVDSNQPLEFELLYNQRYSDTRKRYRTLLVEKRSDGLALKFEEMHRQDGLKLAAMVEWVATIDSTSRLRKPRRQLVYISDLMNTQTTYDSYQ